MEGYLAFEEGHVGWRKGELLFTRESSKTAWSSAQGQMKSQLRVCISVFEAKPRWVMLWWVSAMEKVDEASSDNCKKPCAHSPRCSWSTLLLQSSKRLYPTSGGGTMYLLEGQDSTAPEIREGSGVC